MSMRELPLRSRLRHAAILVACSLALAPVPGLAQTPSSAFDVHEATIADLQARYHGEARSAIHADRDPVPCTLSVTPTPAMR